MDSTTAMLALKRDKKPVLHIPVRQCGVSLEVGSIRRQGRWTILSLNLNPFSLFFKGAAKLYKSKNGFQVVVVRLYVSFLMKYRSLTFQLSQLQ